MIALFVHEREVELEGDDESHLSLATHRQMCILHVFPRLKGFLLHEREVDFPLSRWRVRASCAVPERVSRHFGLSERVTRHRGLPEQVTRHFGLSERVTRRFGLSEGVTRHCGLPERVTRRYGLPERVPSHCGLSERVPRHFGLPERVTRRFGLSEIVTCRSSHGTRDGRSRRQGPAVCLGYSLFRWENRCRAGTGWVMDFARYKSRVIPVVTFLTPLA